MSRPSSPSTSPSRPDPGCGPGPVYLVGAGPGDPELITVRGLRCLRRADVVVYDRLVAPALLDEAPEWAERIFVGKAAGLHLIAQEDINRLLVERARRGAVVVRLKGGAPFVFGRGGEEASALAAAGIPWEVVPAVSSAIGVPARAGIPVTDRRAAAAFAVVTAHRADEAADTLDWRALAAIDTLVVLMGTAVLAQIVERLVAAGRVATTPVAIIERGTLPGERVLTGTLASIVELATQARLAAPATIVVGAVVGLRQSLLAAVPAGAPVSVHGPAFLPFELPTFDVTGAVPDVQ